MNNLTVIGEVFVDCEKIETVNRSVNEILQSYSAHFDTVHYIGPGEQKITMKKGIGENIIVSTIENYKKPLKNRLKYYLNYNYAKNRYKFLLKESQADIVQLRIPSFFSMLAYPTVKNMNLSLTTYIAGDWVSSFTANYKFPGNHFVAKSLDKIQNPIIKNSIPVTAGPVLADYYSPINICHPYFSTTHREVYNKDFKKNPKDLLFVGRLEPRKRVEDAIRSVKLLRDNGYDVKLSIVGEGIMKEKLLKLTKELDLKNHVTFKGNIRDKELLKEEYLNADILVLPSLSEGTPKVLAEAMAHSVIPIAVTGVGSNDYIIQQGQNGFLVSKESPEAIADSVIKIVNNSKMYQQMMAHSKEYASNHTLDKEVEKLWSFVASKA